MAKVPTSLKTAFIRVTADNNTKDNGIVKYSKDDIHNLLDEWTKTLEFNYWFVEHNADDVNDNKHYHIVLKFNVKKDQAIPFKTLKNKFPYGKIESAKNIKNCIQYLIHYNDLSKKQYSWEDIYTNVDEVEMAKYKVKTSSVVEQEVEYYIDLIDKGIIREYNQYVEIPNNIWARNKTVIKNSLEHYIGRIAMEKNRSIRVVFMSGGTGTGKTTFAKKYCEVSNKSYCLSSSSNDPMQDYKGEDVLIFDDLRDTEFTFTDLLKILDNHTNSTVKSRYRNKVFIGDTIIITSYKPLCDWYFNVDVEAKKQLYRRIKEQFQFETGNKIIKAFQFNDQYKRYDLIKTFKNPFIIINDEYTSFIDDIDNIIEIEQVENSNEEKQIYQENEFQIVYDDDVPFLKMS